ncbi:hypothetical protein [Streptomyces hypolithicus]
MNSKMRITAAALTAAVALGVAAPAASAVEHRSQTVSSVQVAQTGAVRDVGALGTVKSASQSKSGAAAGNVAQGEIQVRGMSSLAKKLVKKIVDSRYGRQAIKAAKRGRAAFKRWVSSLSNFNPLKWAIKAAPAYVLDEVISYLASRV